MSTAPRAIRLRRPATLSVTDEPFVPEAAPAGSAEIERRWEALCRANPAYFDGRLYHVFGVHRNGHGGAVVHVADCAYRYHAVQDGGFDLGVRPLGVKGLVARDGRLLLGRRSARVASYGGQWEFAPGGVVDPGETPEQTVARELREETGLHCLGAPVPIALLYDDVLRCWEVILRLRTENAIAPETDEYDDLAWCAPDALPADLTPLARMMVREGVIGPR